MYHLAAFHTEPKDDRNPSEEIKLTGCDVKRQLLADYLARLERCKVAEQEHKEILTVGTGDGVVLRSTQRIEAIKAMSGEARARYAEHCHALRC